MSRYVFKLPDLGEGTVQAEIVSWRVKPGDTVTEDEVIVEVMTEKAAVEVPAPVSGRVVSTTGAPGDMVPVGAELIVFETAAPAGGRRGTGRGSPAAQRPRRAARRPPMVQPRPQSARRRPARAGRVATSPAIRRRAHEAGIDLQQVAGLRTQRPHRAEGPRGVRGPAPRRADTAACAPKAVEAPRAARPRGHRGDQGHRSAPPDRPADERGQAQHPALRLRRGTRHHRARVAAPAPEPQAACRRRLRSPTCRSWRLPWCVCCASSRSATPTTTPSAA